MKTEEQEEREEEVRDVLMRGMNPTWHDLDRAAIIDEAAKLPLSELTPLVARLIVALNDAHARLAKAKAEKERA
jgi:hypothetical protein